MSDETTSAPSLVAGVHRYMGDCPRCGQSILAANGKLPHRCPTCKHPMRSAYPDSPLHNIHRCLRLFCDVRGRSSRREFWAFMPLVLALLTAEAALFVNCYRDGAMSTVPLWLWLVLPIILACPLITLTIRRLHDLNKGPGLLITFLLLALGGTAVIALHAEGILPEYFTKDAAEWAWAALRADIIVGSIILYLSTEHRTPGPNKYGPAPK